MNSWLHGVLELVFLVLGAAIHVVMKWAEWRGTDKGASLGGKFPAYMRQPSAEMLKGVISDVVVFALILGRSEVGATLDGGGGLPEYALLFAVGYFIDSASKRILPMVQTAALSWFQQRIKAWGNK